MKAYLAIIKMRFIMLLQYRVAALTGACTALLFGFVRVLVFYALYKYGASGQPLTYSQTITYIWLGQATLGILPWSAEPEIQAMVRSGNVAYELCRPLSLYSQWFCRSLAFKVAPTLLRGIPILAVVFLLPEGYALQGPGSLKGLLAWGVAITGAVLLSSAITNMANIITLWAISGEGIVRLIPAIVNIFSGILIPLPFFPNWLKGIAEILPFKGLIDTPIRFYLGDLGFSQLAPYLTHQLLWTLAIVLLGQGLLHWKLDKIVVQGG